MSNERPPQVKNVENPADMPDELLERTIRGYSESLYEMQTSLADSIQEKSRSQGQTIRKKLEETAQKLEVLLEELGRRPSMQDGYMSKTDAQRALNAVRFSRTKKKP